MKRPDFPNLDLWEIFIKKFPNESHRLKSLKYFLSAPSDSFLIIDVLEGLIKLKPYLKLGIKPYYKLEEHIQTAQWFLSEIKKYYRREQPPANLSYKTFWPCFLEFNNIQHLSKEEKDHFLNASLWYNYKQSNAIYVALFYPYIEPGVETTASFDNAVVTHTFIKTQILKLISTSVINLQEYALYKLSSGLNKSIQLEAYAHYNTVEYRSVTDACSLVNFLWGIKSSKDLITDALKDDLNLKELTDNEHDKINKSISNIRLFAGKYCEHLKKKRKETHRGPDLSERAKYNRKMGIVLTDDQKALFNLQTEKLTLGNDTSPTAIKSLQDLRLLESSNNPIDAIDDYDDHNDDIDDEIQSEQLTWQEDPACELSNPVASLINAKRSIPHIAYANQQLVKNRLPKGVIYKHFRRLRSYARNLSLDRRPAEQESRKTELWLQPNFQDDSQKNDKGAAQVKEEEDIRVEHIKHFKQILGLIFGRNFNYLLLDRDYPIKADEIYISPDAKHIAFHFPQYKNSTSSDNQIYIASSTEELDLKLPETLQKILLPFLQVLSSHPSKNEGQIIPLTIGKKKNPDLRLLIEASHRNYSQLCKEDSWLLSVFTGIESGLQNTQKHYASYPLRKAQKIFNQHCSTLLKIKKLPELPSPNFPKRIGSPFFLDRKVFSQILEATEKLFFPLLKETKFSKRTNEEIALRFNALSWYVDTFGAFAGGIRNITNPIINPYEVSQEGVYRVNDKNRFDGFNTRMVYVPPELIDLLKQYWQIKQQLIRYLKHQKQFKKKNQEVAKDHHIFVLDLSKKGKIQLHPYKRNRCRDEIAKMAKEQAKHFGFKKRHLKLFDLMRGIKTNVNRHYLRGRLLELDVPGYFIDAYLGHWHTGTQPWGSMSIFHKELYFKMMKATLPKILSELGFKGSEKITQSRI